MLTVTICTSQDESLMTPLLHHVNLAIETATLRGSTLQLFFYGCAS